MTDTLNSLIKRLILLFLIIAGLYYGEEFLMPLCIAGVLATLFLPFCRWMERKKLPKMIAISVCLCTLLGLIFVFISLLGWKLTELINDLALLKFQFTKMGNYVQNYIYNNLNITVKEQLKILKNEQPSYANMLQIMFGSVTHILKNIVLILVYFVFLLVYRNHIKNFIIKLTSPSQQSNMQLILDRSTTVSQQYLIGLAKMIFLLWIMYGIGFSAIGVENAIFFAVLCGLLEIIPFVGNITGTTLTVLVSALHGASFSLLGGIILIYISVQLIQGWVLEPLILGPQVKINPLFTIISLIVGELLWGIPGIVLAIPLTAILKVFCDHYEPLHPYGFLIGEINVTKKEIVEIVT